MSDSAISDWKRSAYVNEPAYNLVRQKNVPNLWGDADSYEHKLRTAHPQIYSLAAPEFKAPRYLIRIFMLGVLMASTGMLVWIFSFLVHLRGLNLYGLIAFAIGSVMVALSLLRGQDISGR